MNPQSELIPLVSNEPNNEEIVIPESLPVLPISDHVLFPRLILNFGFQQEKYVKNNPIFDMNKLALKVKFFSRVFYDKRGRTNGQAALFYPKSCLGENFTFYRANIGKLFSE